MYRVALKQLCKRRPYSTLKEHLNAEAVDEWMASPKQLILADSFHFGHVSDLYITLPTRDGSRKPYQPPQASSPLGYGHHLAFFHPRTPEHLLRADGTEGDFCPPEPHTRRMWAGGKMSWNNENPLIIGEDANATSALASVEKKGFKEAKNPMVFVTQKIDITRAGMKQPSVVEERSHVYLSEATDINRALREVRDVPASADFEFKYTPSLTTLFRFSALTFNGHHIHLDKDHAQEKQGYPERLVHGPLTALMLLETAVFHHPGIQLKFFEYRARNPVIVNRPTTIYGAWKDSSTVILWCVDQDGIVGMTGSIKVS